jgi:hypothetical protein
VPDKTAEADSSSECSTISESDLEDLEWRLRAVDSSVRVAESGVYSKGISAMNLLMDMAVVGLTFPVVLVNGTLVSGNGIDVEAVVRAVQAIAAGSCG